MPIKGYKGPLSKAERTVDTRVAFDHGTRAAVESFLRDTEFRREESVTELADRFGVSTETARELWDQHESQLV